MRVTSIGQGASRLARGIRHVMRQRVIPASSAWTRFLRSPQQLVSGWPDKQAALGPRVVLFAHFDPAGVVREHTLGYVTELAANGFSVVFVSNSRQLQSGAVVRLRRLCAAILVRRNVGYDFGAWREALEWLGLPRPNTEMLVLANDSVYGPLHPLRETMERIQVGEAQVWGLTESWQIGYHLQSYFLAFGPSVLHSAAWRRFWSAVRPAPSKQWVIRHFEVGLTRAMVRAGFTCKAVWDCRDLCCVAGRKPPSACNPTSDFWRQLLRIRFPFIKRELLRDNPTRVPDVGDWRAVAKETGALDLDPILIDLARDR